MIKRNDGCRWEPPIYRDPPIYRWDPPISKKLRGGGILPLSSIKVYKVTLHAHMGKGSD